MPKEAVSVTLESENILWLRGQAHAGVRSLSAVLDRLVLAARSGGQVHEAAIRSVVGTVRISDVDPELLGADAALRTLFPAAMAAESAAGYAGTKRNRRAKRRPKR